MSFSFDHAIWLLPEALKTTMKIKTTIITIFGSALAWIITPFAAAGVLVISVFTISVYPIVILKGLFDDWSNT